MEQEEEYTRSSQPSFQSSQPNFSDSTSEPASGGFNDPDITPKSTDEDDDALSYFAKLAAD
jgi:hypothetical protein